MGHKKRERYRGIQKGSGEGQLQPAIRHKQKGRGTKIFLGLFAAILIGGIGYWQLSSRATPSSSSTPTSPQSYPQTVTGKPYASPTILYGGSSVSLPANVVNNNKLTFLDLKLKNPLNELTYQGRTIPLGQYGNGQYLPLVIISTPAGKVITGIRVCEPCGSFSFHIVEGRYLDCDLCHTKWDLETLSGVSGGCPNYPPPKLPTSAANDITVDLSTLGVQIIS